MNAKQSIARTLLAASVTIISAGSAHAQEACPCGDGELVTSAAEIATLLGGQTVCASLSATEQWQEYHSTDGTLTDYKKGPTDPIDPSKVVGSWSAVGNGVNAHVAYNYGSGGTYQYEVCKGTTGNVLFCGGRNIAGSLRAGQVSCGF
jgi:hypothetical protein